MAIQLPVRRPTGGEDAATTQALRAARCAPDRFDRLRRPCPTCGELGVRIVYGYPSRPLQVAARQGKVVLGGCTHRGATHVCSHGHQWEDRSR